MRHNAATTALRLLLDACNDESDEDVQEALDKLSDEIERGYWPQARVAVTQFLGADEDAAATAVVEDEERAHDDAWGDDS